MTAVFGVMNDWSLDLRRIQMDKRDAADTGRRG